MLTIVVPLLFIKPTKRISVILLLCLASCQLFDKKVPDENELLQQELQKINWDQVDEYPSVYNCDSFKDMKAKNPSIRRAKCSEFE